MGLRRGMLRKWRSSEPGRRAYRLFFSFGFSFASFFWRNGGEHHYDGMVARGLLRRCWMGGDWGNRVRQPPLLRLAEPLKWPFGLHVTGYK